MAVIIQSNTIFEKISKLIFSDRFNLDWLHRLFLQTWFVKVGIDNIHLYEPLLTNLQEYIKTGTPSEFIIEMIKDHPKFLPWFGKTLVNNIKALHVIDTIIESRIIFESNEIPPYVNETQIFILKYDLANRLQRITGQQYPKPNMPIHFILSESSTHAYNVFPDSIVHFKKDNMKWYIGGFGHEAGHLLTWGICNEEIFKQLCRNEITKGFNEIVATFLCKLLMDDCGIAVNDVFEDIPNWESFMYEKNPGTPLFKRMIEKIKLGSYKDFREECINLLKEFEERGLTSR